MATPINAAAFIKQTVTMPQVLAMYGYDTPRGKRIPCPIHNGEKRNFAYKDDWFKCYVCGANGTVIDFVMLIFGLSFIDAIKRIDADFRFGLFDDADEERQRKLNDLCERRREEKRRRDGKKTALYNAYHSALDDWVLYDRIIRTEAPQTPYDDFSPSYAYALRRIDEAWYAVEEANAAIWKFEHEKESA